MSGWAVVRDHAPMMPWEVDRPFDGDVPWNPDRLSEQEFWAVLDRQYGRLIALRCWERYVSDERALERIFAECPEQVAVWMCATNEDDRLRGLRQRRRLIRTRSVVRHRLARIVGVLRRCTYKGEVLLQDELHVWLVVDTFLTARRLIDPKVWWEVPPTEEQQEIAIALVTLAWKVLHLSDEQFDRLRGPIG